MLRNVRPHKPTPHYLVPKTKGKSHKPIGASQRPTAGLHTHMFMFQAVDRVWEDLIRITKVCPNTEVSFYKLLSRQGALRG